MKKNIFLIFVLSQIAVHSLAQQSEPKFSVQVIAGASAPVGKFADKTISKDTSSKSPGLAKPGIALQFAFDYRIYKLFGATVLLGGEENAQDANSYNNYFSQINPSPEPYSTKTQRWKTGKILAGGFTKIPLSVGNKFYFQSRLLVGAMKTAIPGYYASSIGWASQVSSIPLSWAFCYQLEAGFGWQFTSKIIFSASLNYFHSSPNRQYTVYSFTTLPPTGNGKYYDTHYPISSINVLAGVGYRF